MKGSTHYNFGRKISEQTREKMSNAHKGKKHSAWTKLKISWHNEGKKISEENKEKLRKLRTGSKMSEETKKKISIFNKGKKLTEEHKKKIGDVQKGKIVSEESKRKQSISRIGKHPTLETRKKISESFKGSKNPQWIDGRTPLNQVVRRSLEYRLWRKSVFERDKYTCIFCGDNKGGNLNADHIKPFALYPELRFAINNGRTLCETCHRKTDTFGEGTKKIMKQKLLNKIISTDEKVAQQLDLSDKEQK